MSPVSEVYPSIAGRTVMVTGGSRGLGREMVLALAEAGAAVAVVGSRPGTALDDTVADANRLGAGRAVAMAADVSDYAQCEAAAVAVLDTLGPIDVLINNAGLGMRRVSETFNTKPTRFWETEPEAWKEIIDTNVNGAFNMARRPGSGHGFTRLRQGDQHLHQRPDHGPPGLLAIWAEQGCA
jgi:NAD(P)-dependent dehydrogenase (short-subunit alcohol dehydrogenase family)